MEDTLSGLVGVAIALAIGGWLGEKFKGNATAGVLLGLLGPLGWVLVLVLRDRRVKCPECKSAVNPGARKCAKCGATLTAMAARA